MEWREIRSVEKKARDHYSGETASKFLNALALIITSGFSRVIGNFFPGLNKPDFPVKLFTSEEKAVGWLKIFLSQENK